MGVTSKAGRTVVFVCEHGAARSRLAAAWFNAMAGDGWSATSAGLTPQAMVGEHVPRLLAGTAAEAWLDTAPPRSLSAVAEPALIVAIDCRPDFVTPGRPPETLRWQLVSRAFDDSMCREIRRLVEDLLGRLDAISITSVDPHLTQAVWTGSTAMNSHGD